MNENILFCDSLVLIFFQTHFIQNVNLWYHFIRDSEKTILDFSIPLSFVLISPFQFPFTTFSTLKFLFLGIWKSNFLPFFTVFNLLTFFLALHRCTLLPKRWWNNSRVFRLHYSVVLSFIVFARLILRKFSFATLFCDIIFSLCYTSFDHEKNWNTFVLFEKTLHIFFSEIIPLTN